MISLRWDIRLQSVCVYRQKPRLNSLVKRICLRLITGGKGREWSWIWRGARGRHWPVQSQFRAEMLRSVHALDSLPWCLEFSRWCRRGIYIWNRSHPFYRRFNVWIRRVAVFSKRMRYWRNPLKGGTHADLFLCGKRSRLWNNINILGEKSMWSFYID